MDISKLIFLVLMVIFGFANTKLLAEENNLTIEELRQLRDELKAKNESLKKELNIQQRETVQITEEAEISDSGYMDDEKEEKLFVEPQSVNEITVEKVNPLNDKDTAGIKETLVIQKDGYTEKTVIMSNGQSSKITTISISDNTEELEEEIEKLNEKLEEAKDELEEIREEIDEEIEEGKEEAAEIKEDLEEVLEEASDRSSGAVVFMPELKWLDVDPIAELVTKEKCLIGKNFDFSKDMMPTLNFAGYADIEGKGVRVGQIFSSGYKLFESEVFTSLEIDSITNDTTLADSVVKLHVIPIYLGFTFEKAFKIKVASLYTGFMIGGGALMLIKESSPANPESIFKDSKSYENGYEDDASFSAAPSLNWDIHFGGSVKLTESFSLGLEGVFNFAYAFYGFGTGHDEYVTWSPGIRLRFGFGKGC